MGWALGLGRLVPGWLRAAAFWASAAAVVGLSLAPVAHLPPLVFDLWDKAQHALGFMVLAWLGLWAYPRHTLRVLVGLLLLGAWIEWAQSATGWRHGDWLDWLADAAGVAVAAGVLWALRSRTAPPP